MMVEESTPTPTTSGTSSLPSYDVAIQLRFHARESLVPRGVGSDAHQTGVMYASDVAHVMHQGYLYRARTYTFYYEANLALGCWGTRINPMSRCWGYHPHDLEAVTVLFTQGGLPRHVFFFAHSDRQGMWVPWDKCMRTRDGALVVYVARHSHASYPWPGRYMRVFGFANDACSGSGTWLNPVALPARDVDLEGDFHMSAKARMPPPESITSWQRFALPCYSKLR